MIDLMAWIGFVAGILCLLAWYDEWRGTSEREFKRRERAAWAKINWRPL